MQVLAREPELQFRLLSQCVLDAIHDGLWSEALAVVTHDVAPLVSAQPFFQTAFEKLMTLFALPDPLTSPSAALLSSAHRQGTVDCANLALLRVDGLEPGLRRLPC